MLIDIFTYTKASSKGHFELTELLEEAKAKKLDGFCVTDQAYSAHAKEIEKTAKKSGLFIGQGVEIETEAGPVVAFPKKIDDDYCEERWRSLGALPTLEAVLDFFHQREAVVVARDVYHQGKGLKDKVFTAKDSTGRGFDSIDTLAPYRRRIDNELSMEAQKELKLPAVAGSSTAERLESLGLCATLFSDKICDQESFVAALKGNKHWACTLGDIGEACPMGAMPKPESSRYEEREGRGARQERTRGKKTEHFQRGNERRSRGR